MKYKNFYRCIALTFATGLVSSAAFAKDKDSLKEVYRDSFKVGVAINQEISSGQDTRWTPLLNKHFNTITPENVMKAERINPEPDVYNFKPADDLVALGKKNKMAIRWSGITRLPIGFLKMQKANSTPQNKPLKICASSSK
jgi:GH35 family endo-1,4-beta-xylanase